MNNDAAKQSPIEYREAARMIPWDERTSLRDVLTHQYEGVNLYEVLVMVGNGLPAIRKSIVSIRPSLYQLEHELYE